MRDTVREETISLIRKMPVPVLAFLLITLLLGKCSFSMVVSVLLGSTYAVFNFMLLGRSVRKALEKPAQKAQATMVFGYALRFLLMGLVLVIGVKTPGIQIVGLVIPLFFPKLILYIQVMKEQLTK